MASWRNKMYEYVPPVTIETGQEEIQTVVYEPNVKVDPLQLPLVASRTEKSNLALSGKGRLISVDIRNKQDNESTLLGLGVIFKVKKP